MFRNIYVRKKVELEELKSCLLKYEEKIMELEKNTKKCIRKNQGLTKNLDFLDRMKENDQKRREDLQKIREDIERKERLVSMLGLLI